MQGGVETALLSAIPKLAATYDLYIICIGTIDPNFLNKSSSATYQLKQLRYPIWLLPWAVFKALRYLIKLKPDVVITSLWKASFVGGLYKTIKTKNILISFIHNNKFFSLPDSISTRFAIKKSDTVFCDSKASANFVAPLARQKPISIISFLRFPTPSCVKIKDYLTLNAIFLGRLSQQKRIDKLLTLISLCKDRGINFSLDIYGRDPEGLKRTLIAKSLELNLQQQVTFKEEVPPQQVQDILRRYDFYMQTSENEGMAMSVVEAMQLGVVPIVTAVGEIKHYAQDMYNAIIVPNNMERDEFLKNIANTVSSISLYNQLSQNAHATFAKQPEYADSLINKINHIL